MPLNLTEYEHFFFLRERFCGLEYAENAFAAGGPHWGSSQRSPDPLVGWGGATPPRLTPSSAWVCPRRHNFRLHPCHKYQSSCDDGCNNTISRRHDIAKTALRQTYHTIRFVSYGAFVTEHHTIHRNSAVVQ